MAVNNSTERRKTLQASKGTPDDRKRWGIVALFLCLELVLKKSTDARYTVGVGGTKTKFPTPHVELLNFELQTGGGGAWHRPFPLRLNNKYLKIQLGGGRELPPPPPA